MATPVLAVRAAAVVTVVIGGVMTYWIAMDWIAVAADPDWRGYLEDPAEVPDRGQALAAPTRGGSRRARRRPRPGPRLPTVGLRRAGRSPPHQDRS